MWNRFLRTAAAFSTAHNVYTGRVITAQSGASLGANRLYWRGLRKKHYSGHGAIAQPLGHALQGANVRAFGGFLKDRDDVRRRVLAQVLCHPLDDVRGSVVAVLPVARPHRGDP